MDVLAVEEVSSLSTLLSDNQRKVRALPRTPLKPPVVSKKLDPPKRTRKHAPLRSPTPTLSLITPVWADHFEPSLDALSLRHKFNILSHTGVLRAALLAARRGALLLLGLGGAARAVLPV